VRYDIAYSAKKRRWYLDASWKTPTNKARSLDELRGRPVLAVDHNAGHLAALVTDSSGNPVGSPLTLRVEGAGLPAATRDGHLRAAISTLIATAKAHGCHAIVIEDLDFKNARDEGREQTGRRPSRGARGKSFRALVAGMPTAKVRDRLVQMATNAGLAVVAVDPAYTSKWGAEHWLAPLREISREASGHHAAALVIGRRGLAQRARRRERCDSDPAAHGRERATDSAVWPTPATPGLGEQRTRKPGDHEAKRQPPQRWRKTGPAERASPGDQGSEDRSRRPDAAMSYSLLR
jgi:IS605 OrfB family transposase